MSPGFLTFAATLGGFIALIVGLKVVLEPASALRLGIFRPYRGHPWARGVQEEDVVRFTWARRRIASGELRSSWSEIAVATEPGTAIIEDVAGETAAVRPVEGVSIHHLRR
jgi:hypothetical protein